MLDETAHLDIAKILLSKVTMNTSQYRFDEASDNLKKALKLTKDILGERHEEVADIYSTKGFMEMEKHDYIHALESFDKALEIVEALNPQHSRIALFYLNKGNALLKMGNYERADICLQRAQSLLSSRPNHTPSATDACIKLSFALSWSGQHEYEKSLQSLQEAFAIRSNLLGSTHPDTADVQDAIGSVHRSAGRFQTAVDFYNIALSARLKSLGDKHPSVAASLTNLALAHMGWEKYDEAIKYLVDALAILGDQHFMSATVFKTLALVFDNLKNDTEATDCFNRALEILVNTVGEIDFEVSQICNNLGLSYHRRKMYDKAWDSFQKAQNIKMKLQLADTESMGDTYVNMGLCVFKMRNPTRSFHFVNMGIDIFERVLGQTHTKTKRWMTWLDKHLREPDSDD